MKKPEILIFTPTHEEYRALADGLMGADFDNFTIRVLETGPGMVNTAAAVAAKTGPLLAGRDKILMIVGAGTCGSLSMKLKAGDAVASSSAIITDWVMENDYSRTYGRYGQPAYKALTCDWAREMRLKCPSPQVHELVDRLAAKGFQRGRLLTSDAFVTGLTGKLERGRLFGALGADMESGALAHTAEYHLGGLSWFNLRVVADTLDDSRRAGEAPPDIMETLPLKLLVALSTLDKIPPPSACAGCGSRCGPSGSI
ncbi:hypothetical protein LJB86_01190 [Deltaproteobacteria bacterium OttesenSCG-928-M10]|nr:hypothetical protein [Deltaproteobacteria bacterium OttesenSCG-928-M10]